MGALDLAQTNSTLIADAVNIVNALSASLDGALYGTYNESLYSTSLEQNAAAGTAFVTDFLLVGDIRNLGISSYNAAFNNGSLGDVALSSIAFFPLYDIGKGAYKTADNVFDLKGLDSIADALGSISDASAVYLGNLTRNADIFGATSFSLENSVNSVVTSASRNGLDFTSVVVQDANAFSNSLGLNLNGLTTNAAKGEFGEKASQLWATSNGWDTFYRSSSPNSTGLDNVYINTTTGKFVIDESKWVSSNSNVGLGTLSNSTGNRQLSREWLIGGGPNGNNAINRTPGLTDSQRQNIYNAVNSGNYETQLFVIRPRHVGSGITQRLANDPTFGANGANTITNIVIMEVPIN